MSSSLRVWSIGWLGATCVSSVLFLICLALVSIVGLEWSWLEVLATATGAHCVWLLARNHVSGWWIGIISVAAFAVVFASARLYGEVGLQVFYIGTSLQAVWLWLRGGAARSPRRVTNVPANVITRSTLLLVGGVAILWWVLSRVGGAAPFWDALTVGLSVTAHLWLVWRYVQAWMIWIAVDLIFVPLYLTRGLTLTAGLYIGFLIMSINGLRRFRIERQRVSPSVIALRS